GSANGTLTINAKVTPTIVWNNPADITFGAALSATQLNATAINPNDSSSVAGTFTYMPPSGTQLNAGANQNLHVDFVPSDTAHFNSNSKNVSLNVLKANQSITFGALAGKTFGNADFNVSATASSGLSVSFGASGNCTVSGNTVHLTGAGSCTITASQAGNSNYNAATDVPQTFSIAKANQTITFGTLADKTFGEADFNVSATASSGLNVSFGATGNCTVSSNVVHLTGAGACTITASQAGDSNYNAATNVARSFNIAKANQLITFGTLTDKTFGDADFPVSAAADSNLSVSFAATGNCTLSGNTVHITGAGSCTVTASQAGNQNYNAASDVARSFNIAKANQTINFGVLQNKTLGAPPFPVSATASSLLTVTFGIQSGPATISGNTVTLTGAGHVVVRASQSGDANYNADSDTHADPNSDANADSNSVAACNAVAGDVQAARILRCGRRNRRTRCSRFQRRWKSRCHFPRTSAVLQWPWRISGVGSRS